MRGAVYDQLVGVLRRQRQYHLARAAVAGALSGSLVGLVAGAGRWLGWGEWPLAAALAGVTGLATATVAVVRRWPTWDTAAAAVDARGNLKGRARAALEFVALGIPTAIHEVQVADATDALRRVNPHEVAPSRSPRATPLAIVVLAAAVTVLTWPLPARPAPPPPEPLPGVVAEANVMLGGLTRLADEARRQNDPELGMFVDGLRAKLEDMKRPGVDAREALATLTEVGDALESLRAELVATDESLREAGEAMTTSQTLKAAGEALKGGRYQEAAAALDQGRKNPPAPGEGTRATGEMLKRVAARMQLMKQERLSQATGQMAAALTETSKSERYARACDDLAREARQHDSRRRMIRLAEEERRRLEECLSRIASENAHRQNQDSSGSNSGGGSSSQPSASESQTGRQQPRPSGGVGDKNGSPPRPTAELMVELPAAEGAPGSTTVAPSTPGTSPNPGGAPAKMPLGQALPKARQLAEAEIAREDIPVGYRGMVRSYFESLQPSDPTPR